MLVHSLLATSAVLADMMAQLVLCLPELGLHASCVLPTIDPSTAEAQLQSQQRAATVHAVKAKLVVETDENNLRGGLRLAAKDQLWSRSL
jgi:hypothetical protein